MIKAKLWHPDLRITGAGAVSAAGWGLSHLAEACLRGTPLPMEEIQRPAGQFRAWDCPGRRVPSAPADLLPKSPRLRRASPITRFMLGAAMEAITSGGYSLGAVPSRLGIIHVVLNAATHYTGRFYGELLAQPTLPSPLIFPETVFNAPASHVAECLGVDGAVSTLVGEANIILEALLMAEQWIDEGQATHCLVIAGEEIDWLSTEAATYYHPKLVTTEGAAAFLLSREPRGPRVKSIAPLLSHHHPASRAKALTAIASAQKSACPPDPHLVTNEVGIQKLDLAETAAWPPDSGLRLRPRTVLGEAMGASAGLQIALGYHLAMTSGPTIISMAGISSSGSLSLVLE